jgi:hypothetical protein
MAFYLVSALPDRAKLSELGCRLAQDEFIALRPFGTALTTSLKNARLRKDGVATWEEEDYCDPPLAEERKAVLDAYFRDLRVEPVKPGAGWKKIESLPRLFPELRG